MIHDKKDSTIVDLSFTIPTKIKAKINLKFMKIHNYLLDYQYNFIYIYVQFIYFTIKTILLDSNVHSDFVLFTCL